MNLRWTLLVGAMLPAILSSCTVDDIEIPADELYTREFVKSFGVIDPSHDWSLVRQGSVTVTTSAPTNVKIYTLDNGKTRLAGDYYDVIGTRELTFDAAAKVDNVIVHAGEFIRQVPVGSTVTIGASTPSSRAIDGTDNLDVTVENGYFWTREYVEAFTSILPEGGQGLANNKIVTDFSFVSDGNPFELYPMYWDTGSHDVLGVYWTDPSTGEFKTKDLFHNNIYGKDPANNEVRIHNMYRKPTQTVADLMITRFSPGNDSKDVALEGDIILYFNREVEKGSNHSVSFKNSNIDLGEPTIAYDSDQNCWTATYHYSGLEQNKEYTLNVAAGSFQAKTGTEGNSNATHPAYSIKFTTKAPAASLKEKSRSVAIKNEDIAGTARNGIVTITFDQNISVAEGKTYTDLGFRRSNTSTITDTEKITDISVDEATLSIKYEGLLSNTKYKITIPAGFVVSTTDNTISNPSIDYKFTTVDVVKVPSYAEAATVSPINATADGTTTAEQELVSNDDILITATHAGGKIVALTDNSTDPATEGWNFTTEGNAEKTKFAIGVFSHLSSSNDYNINNPTAPDENTTHIKLSPKKDMILYAHYATTGNNNVKITNVSTNKVDKGSDETIESSEVNFYQIEKEKDKDGNIVTDSDGNAKIIGYKSFKLKTKYWTLEKGIEYILFFKSSNYAVCAGFSYRLADGFTEEDAPAQWSSSKPGLGNVSISRGVTNDGDGNVTITRDYDSEEAIIKDGFSRLYAKGTNSTTVEGTTTTSTSSLNTYIDKLGGKDDIVTHKVSFTLPKGTLFGFYIRNNNGATRINENQYHNYSMSSLNRSQANSFFANLMESQAEKDGIEGQFFKNGWYKGNKTNYDFDEGRKYSTAATYTTEINGTEYRYFSFEDWIDCDFNDIVFMVAPTTKADVVNLEVETNPFIFAVEDLGATSTTDIDFNDIVFAVEHTAGHKHAFVTMLAAGGTLEAQVLYKGSVIGSNIGYKTSDSEGKATGTSNEYQTDLKHINNWFGVESVGVPINVGGGSMSGYIAPMTVKIDVNEDLSLAPGAESMSGTIIDNAIKNFSIRVVREDGEQTTITAPDHLGMAPQILVLPPQWCWPMEGMPIHEAYPGGIDYDGGLITSFQKWVGNKDADNNTNKKWYEVPTTSKVINHLWNGSDAARHYVRSLQNN